MPVVTIETQLSVQRLVGSAAAGSADGNGFTLADPGVYTASAGEPWFYSATDELAPEDMTAVDANEEVEFEVTDSPITRYIKTVYPYVTNVRFAFQEAEASVVASAQAASESKDDAEAAQAAAETAQGLAEDAKDDAETAAVSLGSIPALPGDGTFTLKSVDDTLTWVEDA